MRPSPGSRPSTLRAVAMAAMVAGMFTAVGVLHTFIRLAVVDEAYALSRDEADHRSLVRENEQLGVELATLRSPSRVEPLARGLGLVRPEPAQIVRVGVPHAPPGAAASRVAVSRTAPSATGQGRRSP